jgi:rubrerythrin
MDTMQLSPPALLQDLQAAFRGEQQAQAGYLAYAQRAEAENHSEIAVLFRSIAHAESIHARNHEEAIRALGDDPRPDPQPPVVLSTRENLANSIAGETHERDTDYPERITDANVARERVSLRSFILAAMAEATHAELFAEALRNLEAGEQIAQEYFVCETCGNVTTTRDFRRCSVCHGGVSSLVVFRALPARTKQKRPKGRKLVKR